MAQIEKETVWSKWQCDCGAQWTSTTEREGPVVCNFSGCNKKKHWARVVGSTSSGKEASKWFKRP